MINNSRSCFSYIKKFYQFLILKCLVNNCKYFPIDFRYHPDIYKTAPAFLLFTFRPIFQNNFYPLHTSTSITRQSHQVTVETNEVRILTVAYLIDRCKWSAHPLSWRDRRCWISFCEGSTTRGSLGSLWERVRFGPALSSPRLLCTWRIAHR